MARLLTGPMAAALLSGAPRGLFVDIQHPSGTGHFCTGVGSRTWNGNTYRGAGPLGKITPMKHSSEIAIQDITFTMSGIDAAIVAQLGDNVRNLSGKVWLACFNWDDTVVRDPYQLVNSELDYQTFTVADDGTATIDIVAHSGFYTLNRGVQEAWTPQNQKLIHSDDTGMDMIPGLQHQDLQWTAT